MHLCGWHLDIFSEGSKRMDAKRGKTVTEQLFGANAVKAGAAAHVDILYDSVTLFHIPDYFTN
jgi:hypothetical protein